jgi:hypothetical protein
MFALNGLLPVLFDVHLRRVYNIAPTLNFQTETRRANLKYTKRSREAATEVLLVFLRV